LEIFDPASTRAQASVRRFLQQGRHRLNCSKARSAW
jgi:hypothetical protein